MKKKIHKPVDLIVANAMHKAADNISYIEQLAGMSEIVSEVKRRELLQLEIARGILITIASEAAPEHVYKALAAIGAPCTPDDISEGLQAVQDGAR